MNPTMENGLNHAQQGALRRMIEEVVTGPNLDLLRKEFQWCDKCDTVIVRLVTCNKENRDNPVTFLRYMDENGEVNYSSSLLENCCWLN